MSVRSDVPPGSKQRLQGEPASSQSQNTGREGGDDALAESSPTDSRSDEKVIVNEQRESKTVNIPSQTAANTSEGNSNDEEIMD
jgi:hypothetical protein